MKQVFFRSVVTILFLSFMTVSHTQAFSHAPEIVGGDEVGDIDEAPYMARFSAGCGASIINEQWVISAAHCKGFFGRAVYAGSLERTNSKSIKLDIDKVIVHPKYRSVSRGYDVALIKLKKPIDFSNSILKPVKMADGEFADRGFQDEGIMATVYGWGATREGNSRYPKELRKVEVPIVSNKTANERRSYNGDINETMIAAGYKEGGRDACQNDSGGPMVIFDELNEPVLVGIVSWGRGCARKDKYGIYARVSHFEEWIEETIQDNL